MSINHKIFEYTSQDIAHISQDIEYTSQDFEYTLQDIAHTSQDIEYTSQDIRIKQRFFNLHAIEMHVHVKIFLMLPRVGDSTLHGEAS